MAKDDLSVVICGEAGQGLKTIETLFAKTVKSAGYHVFVNKEIMSRIRGGSNSSQIRISTFPRRARLDRTDVFIPLDKAAIGHVERQRRLQPETVIVGDRNTISPDREIIDVPFTELAKTAGKSLYANSVVIGLICGVLGIDFTLIKGELSTRFANKSKEIITNNVNAARAGYDHADPVKNALSDRLPTKTQDNHGSRAVFNGAQAVAYGALAGGCDFISSYPMSPSTGVLENLAALSNHLSVTVEQAEDEISAVNMGLGAWYAGGRALVSTSGGGFALMQEGISLSGITETPLVVHLAQRPGPGTGLPTRTEQGDLNLVVYAGHGDFPRIVLAPGTIEDAFILTGHAFDLADRFQIPVIILTDEFLMDSYYDLTPLDPSLVGQTAPHIVKSTSDYQRYRLTEDGVSPRSVPGYGNGLVMVDSDEHDEDGRITEDLDTRKAMVEKRNLRKRRAVLGAALPPRISGAKKYKHLLICWGTTYPVTAEALEKMDRDDTALLYCPQVFPIAEDITYYINRAETIVVVENNATGQFADLLRLHVGIDKVERILRFSGTAFSVEELTDRLAAVLDSTDKEGITV